MALAHFSILNNEFLNKDPYAVPEQAPIIILDIKSSFYMPNNGKNTKHTRHISRRIYFVRNGEELNLHKTVWYDIGLKLADIGTNNIG